MKIIVQKFGGTSVADAQKIRRAAKRVIKTVEEGFNVIEANNFNDGNTIASVADMENLIFEG